MKASQSRWGAWFWISWKCCIGPLLFFCVTKFMNMLLMCSHSIQIQKCRNHQVYLYLLKYLTALVTLSYCAVSSWNSGDHHGKPSPLFFSFFTSLSYCFVTSFKCTMHQSMANSWKWLTEVILWYSQSQWTLQNTSTPLKVSHVECFINCLCYNCNIKCIWNCRCGAWYGN